MRCRLRPVIKVAKMLKRHLPNLLSCFRHRLTNATSEGFNSVIQALKYAARGFRSANPVLLREARSQAATTLPHFEWHRWAHCPLRLRALAFASRIRCSIVRK